MNFCCSYINNAGEKLLLFFNEELTADKRVTAGWFLMDHCQVFAIALSYFIFVSLVYIYKIFFLNNEGKIYEKKRNEDDENKLSKRKVNHADRSRKGSIDIVMPFYNLTQVILSFYITYATIMQARKRNFSFIFNEFGYTETSMATYSWLFYLSKIFDITDTILIVLRKKWNQFTFLHIYHHLSVLIIMWINTSVGYDGDIYYIITINSFVHFIMYFYYLLASLKVKIPILFKACVTYIQMIQFCCIMLPGFGVLFLGYECAYPKRILALSYYYCASLLVLFMNFTINTYFVKNKQKQA